ncbi:unnamed protein product [Diamesa serratosioi]
MSTAVKSITKTVNHNNNSLNNGCTNGIANLCCQPTTQTNIVTKPMPLQEQNIKKVVKVNDAPTMNGINGKVHKRSPAPFVELCPDSNAPDMSNMKIIEAENNPSGIKLTDIALPHISVQTTECKKNEKPMTTIIIYKPKNSNRAPTAKVIMTKV